MIIVIKYFAHRWNKTYDERIYHIKITKGKEKISYFPNKVPNRVRWHLNIMKTIYHNKSYITFIRYIDKDINNAYYVDNGMTNNEYVLKRELLL